MTNKFTAVWPLTLGALLALLLAVPLFILDSGRAEAHAVQVGSIPAPNSQLAGPPGEITITFSEPIETSVTSIQLWDGTPEEIVVGDVSFPSSTEVVAQVPDELPMGVYTVVWRNLSTVDGHTWAGSFPFTLLGPNGEVPAGGTAVSVEDLIDLPSDTPSTLDSVARWVVLLGSAVMLGGTAYVLTVAFPAARVLSPEASAKLRSLSRTVLLVTGAIAAFLVLEGSTIQLLLQADRLGGLDKVDDILRNTRPGRYLIARQVLLVVALGGLTVAWRAGDRVAALPGLGLLLIASVGVLLTQSLVSHAGATDGPFWSTSADFLHLLAASLWVGGLIHVGLAMPRWLDELKGAPRTLFAGESFRRFSVLAVVSVVVIISSGLLSAFVQLNSWSDLWSSSYGWSLVGKLGAMVPLLAVGGLNAFILRPRVVDAAREVNGGDPEGDAVPGAVARLQRLLANTVRVEAVLGVLVLVAVGVLIQLEPPRAAAEAEAAASVVAPTGPLPQDERGYFVKANQEGGLVISLKVDPAQVGQNNFEVGLGSEFGGIGEVLQTRLEFNNPSADIPASRLELPLAGSARFAADGGNLSLPGDWEVKVTVRRRGEDDVSSKFDVPLRSEGAEGPTAGGESSGGIWDWPFDGARSAAAIAVLAVVGAAGVGWGTVSLGRRER